MPRISAIALTVVGATIVAACSTPKAGDLGSAGVGGTAAKAGTGGTAIIGNPFCALLTPTSPVSVTARSRKQKRPSSGSAPCRTFAKPPSES